MKKKLSLILILFIPLLINASSLNDKLIDAINNNDIKQVQKILKRKIDLNQPDEYGNTPLHYAVMNDNTEIIKLLVQKGADIEIQNKFKETPLKFAVYNKKKFETIKTLLELGANPNSKEGITPSIFEVIRYKDIKLLKLFTEYTDVVNCYRSGGWGILTPLQCIINEKAPDEMSIIIFDAFPDINSSDAVGFSPIHYAVNNIELLKYVINKGADVNIESKTKRRETALRIAVRKNDLESIKLLLDKGADVKSQELKIAIDNDRTNIAKLLVENANDIDILLNGSMSNYFHTPLYYSILTNNAELVEYLIKKGANVNMYDSSKKSFLDHAQEYKFTKKIADILKKAGAKDGKTLFEMNMKKQMEEKEKKRKEQENHILGTFIKAFRKNDIDKMVTHIENNIEFINNSSYYEFSKWEAKNNPHILNKNEAKELLGLPYFKEAANFIPYEISDDYIKKTYKYLLSINKSGYHVTSLYFDLINGKPILKLVEIHIYSN